MIANREPGAVPRPFWPGTRRVGLWRLPAQRRFARRFLFRPPPGQIGCYLSHFKAYRALLDSGDESALILEDDAELSSELPDCLDPMTHAAQEIDLLFLEDRRPHRANWSDKPGPPDLPQAF